MTTRAHVLTAIAGIATTLFILRLVGRQQLRSKYALLWLTIGVLVLPLALFPHLLVTVSNWFGVAYAPTTFLLFAIGFLLVVVIYLSRELSQVEVHLRSVAEDLALLRASSEAEREDQ
ncbi:MAG: hypothetical protein JWL83_3665 [Actinomycetia bacterium]|jgi:hypothetical protein|nr:hypothetical protein [Actinomycetes bacterium]